MYLIKYDNGNLKQFANLWKTKLRDTCIVPLLCGGVEGEIVHRDFIAYVKRDTIRDVLTVEADELACFWTEADGSTVG